jgi:hypothetical protein
MDEYNVSMLTSSKDEWICRLVNILTPLIAEGIKSIFIEAYNLCKTNKEMTKYLMTFQNFISRIPSWNTTLIETERKRIINKSGCHYLEDLLTCVHIIQLKLLTAVRVGQKQKKIDISILKIDDFIHKTYINVARKIYKNVYLYEYDVSALQIQKNNREIELIIQECIINTIRESIPIESILKAYMDETIEEDVLEEFNEKIINEKIDEEVINNQINKNMIENQEKQINKNESLLETPQILSKLKENENVKTIKTNLENTITFDNIPSKTMTFDNLSSISDDENENIKIKITDEITNLNDLDVHVINEPKIKLNENDLLINDIEILS